MILFPNLHAVKKDIFKLQIERKLYVLFYSNDDNVQYYAFNIDHIDNPVIKGMGRTDRQAN